jgi:hypothetical protein
VLNIRSQSFQEQARVESQGSGGIVARAVAKPIAYGAVRRSRLKDSTQEALSGFVTVIERPSNREESAMLDHLCSQFAHPTSLLPNP